MVKYLDDDENMKDLRRTARTFGLTALLVKASRSTNFKTTKALLRKALVLLGERS
jgi:hypothetical protein